MKIQAIDKEVLDGFQIGMYLESLIGDLFLFQVNKARNRPTVLALSFHIWITVGVSFKFVSCLTFLFFFSIFSSSICILSLQVWALFIA